ncbi:MAG: GNAT family N-acetyltransferase [Anaerolineae bacterium]|nr:GNAT family N-acetyltransferase [Anaerolineae bacterium]
MPLLFASALRESITAIAAAICVVWEADADTPAVYAEQCRVQSIDLEHSVLAYLPDGQLVGVGILCRRGQRGFVLDFGISPAVRGQGYGHQLFAALMAEARRAGLEEVSLVVNADNQPAQRIYRKAGFEQVRELVTLRGKAPAYAAGAAAEIGADLQQAILAWSGPGRAGKPYWERELASLLVQAESRGFETRHGFLLARRSAYHRQVDLLQLALDPEAETEDVNGLLHAAGEVFGPVLPLALLGEPVGSRVYTHLGSLGFQVIERIYEMRLRP